MGIEIERKFLIEKHKWQESDKGVKEYYRQGYIISEPGKTVRVRLTDSSGYLTIKGPTAGISKPEFEYPIPKDDAQTLLDMFCASIVSKWRHKVVYKNKLWEVDEFLEDNEGLMIAEIELQSEDETFQLPDWVSTEVTGDKKYSNSSLSVNPFKNWKQE